MREADVAPGGFSMVPPTFRATSLAQILQLPPPISARQLSPAANVVRPKWQST